MASCSAGCGELFRGMWRVVPRDVAGYSARISIPLFDVEGRASYMDYPARFHDGELKRRSSPNVVDVKAPSRKQDRPRLFACWLHLAKTVRASLMLTTRPCAGDHNDGRIGAAVARKSRRADAVLGIRWSGRGPPAPADYGIARYREYRAGR